jgi:cell division inhibitor SulA
MTEQEYIDISNLARLRCVHSVMGWLLPMTKEEHAAFDQAQKALHTWLQMLEKKTDGLVR